MAAGQLYYAGSVFHFDLQAVFPGADSQPGATQVELQQTLTAYLAAFGFMMLLHGPLSDAFGRRPVILGGLAVYMLASIGGALASSLGILLFCRTLQGYDLGLLLELLNSCAD